MLSVMSRCRLDTESRYKQQNVVGDCVGNKESWLIRQDGILQEFVTIQLILTHTEIETD